MCVGAVLVGTEPFFLDEILVNVGAAIDHVNVLDGDFEDLVLGASLLEFFGGAHGIVHLGCIYDGTHYALTISYIPWVVKLFYHMDLYKLDSLLHLLLLLVL